MPFLKKARKEQLSKIWDKKAQKCGLRHTVYSVNGEEYTGEWLNNKKHGKGTNIWKKSGVLYDGEWKYGQRHGLGTLSTLNPVSKEYVKLYSGEWENDKRNGFGSCFYSGSAHYEGEWRGNERSGWGRMHYENGDVYEGEWLRDKPNGQGLLCLANQNRYEGTWEQGEKHGAGRFFFLDKGQLYEGLWEHGVARCGTVTDFEREEAPAAPPYPIPEVQLMDPHSVLLETGSNLYGAEKNQPVRGQ
ncbi:MORN repeat-containing protein 3 isoform X1 [Brienomyrus brachyistius]|uniref:MORN repeat-containing protein 3 isoform X1 n=1 Tax=Brienomyrus brachyistius TaxID=42636 RepID=UPI0020B17A4C|nr:MORN repeat-containing protein 3 isoform X1 [Brienomyrus brachyistius]